jgi:proline racemase
LRLDHILHVIDAHAEGETSRVVLAGIGDLPGVTMFDKRQHLMAHRDELRRFLLTEPRGTLTLCADIVLPSSHPEADFGYVIIESTDYPPMSGTNTINTATVLLETGMVPMVEPVTRFNLEAPGGLVAIEAQCRDGKAESITFLNQPAFATHLDVPLDVPEVGEMTVDIAYGGGFFVFIDAAALGFSIIPSEARELARMGQLIKRAAAVQYPIRHPQFPDIHTVTFACFTAPPLHGGDGRNTNIVSPGRVDRSACGTATSARLAVLHARGELAVGEDFIHESILSSRFIGQITDTCEIGGYSGVLPSITGRAWIYAVSQIGRHPSDPFGFGYQLSDNWGTEGESWIETPSPGATTAQRQSYASSRGSAPPR